MRVFPTPAAQIYDSQQPSTRDVNASLHDLHDYYLRPVQPSSLRCPIPPSFPVLARAFLWVLGARMWRGNLP